MPIYEFKCLKCSSLILKNFVQLNTASIPIAHSCQSNQTKRKISVFSAKSIGMPMGLKVLLREIPAGPAMAVIAVLVIKWFLISNFIIVLLYDIFICGILVIIIWATYLIINQLSLKGGT